MRATWLPVKEITGYFSPLYWWPRYDMTTSMRLS